jgi:hypothetical protein
MAVRRFGLLDAILLVAAMAVAVSIARSVFTFVLRWPYDPIHDRPWNTLQACLALSASFLIPMTYAILACGVCRTGWRGITRSRGMLPCLCAGLTIVIVAIALLVVRVVAGIPPLRVFLQVMVLRAPIPVGYAVLSISATHRLAGVDADSQAWPERSSRRIGRFWVVWSLLASPELFYF